MKLRLTAVALALAALALSPSTSSAAYQPPPIHHVWVIVLENSSYDRHSGGRSGDNIDSPFTNPRTAPYLYNNLLPQGNLLTQYWGIGHNSLDNYIAMVSGQSPTPGTQSDALFCFGGSFAPDRASDDIPSDAPVGPFGQIVGQGCTYPTKVKTLADQLEAKGLTWKGYMEDLGSSTAVDGGRCPRADQGLYVKKHDPFQWFHSIIDSQSRCLSHDVPLTRLASDLQSVRTTPNFSFISPNLLDDGHDGIWSDNVDPWLRQYVPMIMSSPAYGQDGMILITVDEAATFTGVSFGQDTGACCNQIPGPNSPMPGVTGPGGGRTGALVLSPFVKPGTVDDPPGPPPDTCVGANCAGPGYYNHYSFLRSMEDLFGIKKGGDDGHGHLGFAGSYGPTYPGPGRFGPDVYNNWSRR